MRIGLQIEKNGPPKPLAKMPNGGLIKMRLTRLRSLRKCTLKAFLALWDQLKMPMDPSSDYHYQNVNTALLGLMLTRIYKQPLNVLLSEKIWKPAGASRAHWRTYTNEGSVTPYCCLFATVEDWAKVAYFLSKNGMTIEQITEKRGASRPHSVSSIFKRDQIYDARAV